MLVSGGRILAIDKVLTDWTVSGDGVREPLGLNEDLLKEIQKVSGEQAAIEALEAHSGAWDNAYSAVEEYSAAWNQSAFFEIDDNVRELFSITSSYQDDGTHFILSAAIGEDPEIYGNNGVSAEYNSDLNKYDVGLEQPVFDAISAGSAKLEASADLWNDTYQKVQDSADLWNESYSVLSANSAKWDAYSGFIDECMKTSALDSGSFISSVQDEDGTALFDTEGTMLLGNGDDVSLWSAYNGTGFFAQRASADAFGNRIDLEYVHKFELQDYALKSELSAYANHVEETYFHKDGLNDISGRWEQTSDTVDSNSAKWEKLYETSSTWDGVEALSAHSGVWDSTYSALRDTSADWNKTHEEVEASAYLWNSAYSETSAFKEVDSELWQTASETVAENSAKWNGVEALSEHSGAWDSTYSAVRDTSGDWNAAYQTVKTNSAFWAESADLFVAEDVNDLFEISSKHEDDGWKYQFSAATENFYETAVSAGLALSARFDGTDPQNQYYELGLQQEFFDNVSGASATISENSARWDHYSAVIDECMKSSAIHSGAYSTALMDVEGDPIYDENGIVEGEPEEDHALWSAYSGLEFFAARASADPHGVPFEESYAKKSEFRNYYTKEEADQRFFPIDGLNDTSARWEQTSDTVDANSAKWNGIEALSAQSAYWNTASDTIANNSAKWNGVEALSAASATWNEAAKKLTDSADIWNDTYGTVKENSAFWAESAEFFVVEDQQDLFSISSKHDDAGWHYQFSAALQDPYGIEGSNGVSAQLNAAENRYEVGLEKPFYDNMNTTSAEVDASAKFWNEAYGLASSADGWNKTSGMVADSAYRWNSAYSEVSAFNTVDPDFWDEASQTVADYSAYWIGAASTVSANSANWEGSYEVLESHSGLWYRLSAEYMPVSALHTSSYFDAVTDTENSIIYDLDGDGIYDTNDTELWGDYSGIKFFAERTSADAYGRLIHETYAEKSEIPPSTTLTSSAESVIISSSGVGHYNIEVNHGQIQFSDYSSSRENVGHSTATVLTLTQGVHTGDFDITALDGLYHVDVNLGIRRKAGSASPDTDIFTYSDGVLSINAGPVDGSTYDEQSLNISYDFLATGSSYSYVPSVQSTATDDWEVRIVRLDIHRIYDIPAAVEQIINDTVQYNAGDGITIDPSSREIAAVPGQGIKVEAAGIAIDASSGIAFTQDGKAYVALSSGLAFNNNGQVIVNVGAGLKLETSGTVTTVAVDSVVEEVVEEVEKMTEDMDSKLTYTFDMAQITNTYDFSDSSVSKISNGAGMIYQAFTVPINNEIRLATAEKDGTLFGIYAKQGFATPIMLALYAYDFDTDSTEYVADTGAVIVAAGRNEFPIKHINPAISELMSKNVYYAAIYLPSNRNNGLILAGCQSYTAAGMINAIPRFTVRSENLIVDGSEIDLTDPDKARLDYKDPNNPDNYIIGPWSNGYNEQPDVPRFFMQIRNGHVGTNP